MHAKKAMTIVNHYNLLNTLGYNFRNRATCFKFEHLMAGPKCHAYPAFNALV